MERGLQADMNGSIEIRHEAPAYGDFTLDHVLNYEQAFLYPAHIEDGLLTVTLVAVTHSGPDFKLWFRIEGPTHCGRILVKSASVATCEQAQLFKSDLAAFGVRTHDLAEALSALQKSVGMSLSVLKAGGADREEIYLLHDPTGNKPRRCSGLKVVIGGSTA